MIAEQHFFTDTENFHKYVQLIFTSANTKRLFAKSRYFEVYHRMWQVSQVYINTSKNSAVLAFGKLLLSTKLRELETNVNRKTTKSASSKKQVCRKRGNEVTI